MSQDIPKLEPDGIVSLTYRQILKIRRRKVLKTIKLLCLTGRKNLDEL